MTLRILIILAFLTSSQALLGQRINTEFGKNRVQFHDDFTSWSKYETENFVVYYYGKSRNVAHAVIQLAEYDHDEIQKLLEHRMNDKIEIMVYADLSDMKQSNLGTEEIFQNTKGQTKTVGKKMFVYFDGDHQSLRQQVRQGIADVYLNSIIQGTSVQEVVQNALLLNLPAWFKEGLVSFADESWNNEVDQELLHLLNKKDRYLNFEKLAEEYPRIAGHSMWYFLEQNYGRTRISQLIYITRIYRNLENSFSYVLYVPYDEIVKAWALYYIEKYDLDNHSYPDPGRTLVQLKKKHKKEITRLQFSPNNEYLAYVTNDLGKQKIFIHDLATGKDECVFKNECKNPFQAADENYPLIDWHPNNRSLFIIYEKKDVPYLRKLDIVSKEFSEKSIPESFQRIYSMDFVNDNRILLSASSNGFSDLFFYKPKGRSSDRLTDDIWDDLEAKYVNIDGKKGIVFLSNRLRDTLFREKLDTIMPIAPKDIYFLNLEDEKNPKIQGLGRSPNKDENDLIITDDGSMLYLREYDGFSVRSIKEFFGFSAPFVNSSPTEFIHAHTISQDGSHYASVQEDETYRYIRLEKNPDLSKRFDLSYLEKKGEPAPEEPEETEKPSEAIPQGSLFQSPFDDPNNLEPFIDEVTETESQAVFSGPSSAVDQKNVHKFEVYRASAALLKFKIFDFNTRFDNQPLFEGLESYTDLDPQLNNDPVGLLFRARIKDLFEDYAMEAGARFPTTLNGSEYYLLFDNNKKRWDKRFSIYKKNESTIVNLESPFDRLRKSTILGLVQYKYPFDIFRSIRFTGSLRFDRTFITSTNRPNHDLPFQHDKRLSLKAEYIYDNTFDVGINIKNGLRYKAFVETINQFNIELRSPYVFDLNRGFTTVFGFDARYYYPVLRKSVLAFRMAGAGSLGSKQMLYYIGGVENWILPQFDNSIPIPENNTFAYKALAPHLRGFNHNIRNGGSFAVANVEYRIPFMDMLFGRNLKRPILKHMQFVTFFDAGMAWHGLSPYSDRNPLNTETIVKESTNGPDIIVLNVTYFRDPIVMGYGWGLRTTILGYFFKFDIAKGIESGIVGERRLHISLGYDF